MSLTRQVHSWMTFIVACAFLMSNASCASSQNCPTDAKSQSPPLSLSPCTVDIHCDLTVDLPTDFAGRTGFPTQLKGEMTITGDAEAIEPVRSKYHGNIHVHITDIQGQKTYLNLNTTVSGQENTTPTVALWNIFGQFGNTIIDVMAKSLPDATRPTSIDIAYKTHPTSTSTAKTPEH